MRMSRQAVRRRVNIFTLLTIATLLSFVSVNQSEAKKDLQQLLYDFTADIVIRLNGYDKSKSENMIVSPISINKALNLLLLGAQANSPTEKALVTVLEYTNLDSVPQLREEYTALLNKFESINNKTREVMKKNKKLSENDPRPPIIDFFNMVITKGTSDKVLPKYRSDIREYFHGSVESVGTQCEKDNLLEKLKSWAKEAGFNEPILTEEELNKSFELKLMSAIRLQAYWPLVLQESSGKKGIFYEHGLKDKLQDGTLLSGQDDKGWALLDPNKDPEFNGAFKRFRQLNCRVVKLPLLGDLSFTIFEPLEHSTQNRSQLYKLVKTLFSGRQAFLMELLKLLDGPEGKRNPFELTMPKFKFEKELNLEKTLRNLGLHRALDLERSELFNITGSRLAISSVSHKAMIEVNKNGVKAAGVTKIDLIKAAPVERVKVDIKRPFMFLIRHEKIPLFVGTLTSLSGGDSKKAKRKAANERSKKRRRKRPEMSDE